MTGIHKTTNAVTLSSNPNPSPYPNPNPNPNPSPNPNPNPNQVSHALHETHGERLCGWAEWWNASYGWDADPFTSENATQHLWLRRACAPPR